MPRAALLALALLVPTSVLIDRPGAYDLPRLGYGPGAHDVPAGQEFAARFRLPAGARQGRPLWIGVRIDADAALDAAASDGTDEIVTENNRYICASIRVNAKRLGRQVVVDWDGGPPAVRAAGTARRPVLRLHFGSICIIPSVRGPSGRATWSARSSTGLLTGLRLLPTSGVVAGRRAGDVAYPPGTQGGPPVSFAGVYPSERVRAGRSFALDVRLRAFGRRVPVTVRVRTPRGPVEAIEQRKRVVVRAGPIRTRTSIRLRALRPGRSWVAVSTGSSEVLVLLEVERAS